MGVVPDLAVWTLVGLVTFAFTRALVPHLSVRATLHFWAPALAQVIVSIEAALVVEEEEECGGR